MRRILTPTGALNAWWAVAMLLIASILVGTVCIAYTVHTQRVADRRWHDQQVASERQSCGLLNILDKPLPPGAPDRSVAILREIHAWRVRAGC